jgi:hemoglobin
LFDQIGGDALRAVIEDFYDRVLSDVMIGFLFIGKDRQRLVDKEWEFTAGLLGGSVRYTGRPIREAHAASPIMGGHFDRRLQILKDVMADHDVDAEVRDAWVAHTNSLRSHVTSQPPGVCDD